MKSRLTLPLLVALTIGGYGVGIHGSVPDVPTGQWMPGASLAQPRERGIGRTSRRARPDHWRPHGCWAGWDGESLNSDGSLTVLHSMSLPRGGHTAVRLADDRVLVSEEARPRFRAITREPPKPQRPRSKSFRRAPTRGLSVQR